MAASVATWMCSSNSHRINMCLIVIPIVNVVSCTLPELVILAVYLRLFVQNSSRIACYATGVVLVASCVINVVLFIWQCSPVDYV